MQLVGFHILQPRGAKNQEPDRVLWLKRRASICTGRRARLSNGTENKQPTRQCSFGHFWAIEKQLEGRHGKDIFPLIMGKMLGEHHFPSGETFMFNLGVDYQRVSGAWLNGVKFNPLQYHQTQSSTNLVTVVIPCNSIPSSYSLMGIPFIN